MASPAPAVKIVAHDFFVAFSCKGRGVCPSCNTRRMAETAAHLADHVCCRRPKTDPLEATVPLQN